MPTTSTLTIAQLTKRELDVLRLLVAGHTCPEVADLLYISRETVKSHKRKLYLKLDVRTSAQLGYVAAFIIDN